ncbi:hypothetical protein DLAC_11726 [Tieghemostelium lacteum]|uniref:F-box domain-containing protein n=1 Tax=Tieghemostelium lacteum TaxID=361077 RepID=A0A151Z7M7_TIELA|nr:hypothetical protein DLAC_11726 [Tieghemostelium lacteum]|eukprot:KYQ89961.1 hypothetical protein DLAC_11726 [Tieghemostelium lacteum]
MNFINNNDLISKSICSVELDNINLPQYIIEKILCILFNSKELNGKQKISLNLISKSTFNFISKSYYNSLKIDYSIGNKLSKVLKHYTSPYCSLQCIKHLIISDNTENQDTSSQDILNFWIPVYKKLETLVDRNSKWLFEQSLPFNEVLPCILRMDIGFRSELEFRLREPTTHDTVELKKLGIYISHNSGLLNAIKLLNIVGNTIEDLTVTFDHFQVTFENHDVKTFNEYFFNISHFGGGNQLKRIKSTVNSLPTPFYYNHLESLQYLDVPILNNDILEFIQQSNQLISLKCIINQLAHLNQLLPILNKKPNIKRFSMISRYSGEVGNPHNEEWENLDHIEYISMKSDFYSIDAMLQANMANSSIKELVLFEIYSNEYYPEKLNDFIFYGQDSLEYLETDFKNLISEDLDIMYPVINGCKNLKTIKIIGTYEIMDVHVLGNSPSLENIIISLLVKNIPRIPNFKILHTKEKGKDGPFEIHYIRGQEEPPTLLSNITNYISKWLKF